MWLNSERALKVHFNPAALLSVGDALAFYNTLTATQPDVQAQQQQQQYVPGEVPEKPDMEEQLGTSKPITARVPQKYLV